MEWTDIIVPVISALLGGGLIAILMYPATRRKTEAESRETDARAWAILVEQLSTRVSKLEAAVQHREGKIDAQTERIDELEIEIDELREWIVCQGLTPPSRKRRGK
jgi:peptidoglycan hydrolase CwlO-like protein